MIRSLFKTALLVSTSLLFLSTLPVATHAQSRVTLVTYAAKFVCGKGNEKLVSPGQYFTNINVHNPSLTNNAIYIKRFAIALPEERPGPISGFARGILKPDEAMTIDCENIYKHTQVPPGTFLEGFALIYALVELDVVSVYTAGHTEVEAIHTERVPVRRLTLARTSALAKRIDSEMNQQ